MVMFETEPGVVKELTEIVQIRVLFLSEIIAISAFCMATLVLNLTLEAMNSLTNVAT